MNEHAKELGRLMAAHNLNKGQTARMLSRVTGDDITDRRLRRWFASEKVRPNNRNACPGWAVPCLLVALAMEGHIAPDDVFASVFEYY